MSAATYDMLPPCGREVFFFLFDICRHERARQVHHCHATPQLRCFDGKLLILRGSDRDAEYPLRFSPQEDGHYRRYIKVSRWLPLRCAMPKAHPFPSAKMTAPVAGFPPCLFFRRHGAI